MKRLFIPVIPVLGFLVTVSAQDRQVDLGISIADGKLRSFYLAISDYYRIPRGEVVATKERYRLPHEELSATYFLAARAHVTPSVIIDLRIKGMSWLDITFHYGLTPEIYFVPVKLKNVGPPYGKAYGYYNKYRPKKEWKKIALNDQEVVELVNLRFMTEYYRLTPEDVIQMRGRGKDFISINEESGRAKAKQKGERGKDKKNKASKGKTKRE